MSIPLRIVFSDEDSAYNEFRDFPPLDLQSVSACLRKRDGASHVLLLDLRDPAELPVFLAACMSLPGVVKVVDITELEFVRAPSNSI
jgi:hypothetical protein